MSGIKTAISLDEHLFNEVKETARDLNTSRSGVIRQALLEFMERRKNQRLLDQLNEVYKSRQRRKRILPGKGFRNFIMGVPQATACGFQVDLLFAG